MARSESTSLGASTPRIAYIRTFSKPEYEQFDTFSVMIGRIRQTSPEALEKGIPRHRFLFTAISETDERLLETFIAEIDVPAPTQAPGSTKWRFRDVTRSDLELRISQAHASSSKGESVLRKCAEEGIRTNICGLDDQECDAAALQDSDYLIDSLTLHHFRDNGSWFWSHIRLGVKQDSLLTNESFNMKDFDASKTRLGNRYGQHSWTANSGCSRGNGEWSCRMCGGNCKRGRCKGQPSKRRLAEQREYEERDEEWRASELRLPEFGKPLPGSWRGTNADSLCYRFRKLKLPAFRGEEAWHSIDTFSSE